MYRMLISKWKLRIILISLSAVKFCGGREWRDDVIKSKGHQVTVQFMSGPQNNGHGLFLSYTSSQHTGIWIHLLIVLTSFKACAYAGHVLGVEQNTKMMDISRYISVHISV